VIDPAVFPYKGKSILNNILIKKKDYLVKIPYLSESKWIEFVNTFLINQNMTNMKPS